MPTCAPILVRVWSYGDPLQERCTGCICFVHFVCILHAIFAFRVGLIFEARWGCGVFELDACRLVLYDFCVSVLLIMVFIDFNLLQLSCQSQSTFAFSLNSMFAGLLLASFTFLSSVGFLPFLDLSFVPFLFLVQTQYQYIQCSIRFL